MNVGCNVGGRVYSDLVISRASVGKDTIKIIETINGMISINENETS